MNVRLVDCRPREAYDDGHVPGAVHLDPETTLSSPTDDPSVGGRHPLPDPHALGAAFAAAGIDPETFVLALDEGTGWAARCWWLLRHLGHDLCGTFDQRFYVGPLTTDEPRVEITSSKKLLENRLRETSGLQIGVVFYAQRVLE